MGDEDQQPGRDEDAAADGKDAPAETGDHRFAADDEVADGAAGAEEARTPGMGA